jgi:Fic family protein
VINKKYGFIDICKLCGLMTKLQPFNNGNKRTAICFCNALLVQKDIIPIQVIDYTSYIDKLINYYEDDDKINEYIQFLCKQSNYFGMIDSKLDGNYRNVFGLIKNNPLITKEQIAKILNISEATVSRSVACLKEMGYINGKTSNKSGEWIVKKLI